MIINSRSTGHRMVLAACPTEVIRIVPAGLPPSSLRAAMLASSSSSAGARVYKSSSPASVGATPRVVQFSKRICCALREAECCSLLLSGSDLDHGRLHYWICRYASRSQHL